MIVTPQSLPQRKRDKEFTQRHKKTFYAEGFNNLKLVKSFRQNYNDAVFLSLQQDLVAVAVDLVQQVLPLAHFFDFFLPLSAKAIPVTNRAEVANKNNFFIIIYLIIPVNVRQSAQTAKAKLLNYNVAITVTPPCTTWFNSTLILVPTGNKRSTLLPNLMNPISSVCSTFWPTCK